MLVCPGILVSTSVDRNIGIPIGSVLKTGGGILYINTVVFRNSPRER